MLYPFERVLHGSWFLKSLAIIYAVMALIWTVTATTKGRVSAVVAVYAMLFLTAGHNVAVLSMVFHMFPYFAFGVLVLRPFELYKKLVLALLCGVFFAAVVLFEGNVRTNGMGFYWVPADWRTVVADNHLLLCWGLRTMTGVAGSIFALWTVDLVLKYVPQLSCLAGFGTTTLGVYVLHEWPLVQIHTYFSFASLHSFWRLPLTLALFCTCHYATILIRNHPKLNFFFFGDAKRLSDRISGFRAVTTG